MRLETTSTELDSGHLTIDDFGMFLGKKSERIVVKKQGKVIKEVPFFKLKQIFVTSRGVSISTDFLQECSKRGIIINFLDYRGEPYAQLSIPQLNGTVKTRREQLLAYEDERGVMLARAFAGAKVSNQINLLKYWSRYRRNKELEKKIRDNLNEIQILKDKLMKVQGNKIDLVRQDIMNLEAQAAKYYWDVFTLMVPDEYKFPGRKKQEATDIINSLLNYGYGILYSQVRRAVLLAGLDPFAGFLHADRSGRPSLVLDLIEEFRQPVVDRTVVGLLNWGVKFKIDEEGLTKKTRKRYAEEINKRMNSYVTYEGKKQKLQYILVMQARKVATSIKDERNYEPFIGEW